MKTQNAPVVNYVARETKDACGVTRYSILCDGELMADCLMRSDSVALAQKLNEHAALVAAAEAAKYLRPALDPIPDIAMNGCLCAGCGNWTPKGHPEAHDHDDNCPEVRKRSALAAQSSHNERHGKRILDEALANLAAVRKPETQPCYARHIYDQQQASRAAK
jgi:hypothetical protein